MLPFLCRVYAILHVATILILFTLSKYQRLVPKAKIGTYYIKILLMDFTRESKTTFICTSEKKEECNLKGRKIDLNMTKRKLQ